MKKTYTLLAAIAGLLVIIAIAVYNYNPASNKTIPAPFEPVVTIDSSAIKQEQRIHAKAASLENYLASKGEYNQVTCFLIDMGLPSGRNRFYVYDLRRDSIVKRGLVAHGSCNTSFLREAKFSNTEGCGCSAKGKYKIGYSYNGQFGKAYKLYGLDKTNDNAFRRFIVLHAYDCVPDVETDPQPICNSLGCPMVSYRFLDELSKYISASKKPIMLWMFD